MDDTPTLSTKAMGMDMSIHDISHVKMSSPGFEAPLALDSEADEGDLDSELSTQSFYSYGHVETVQQGKDSDTETPDTPRGSDERDTITLAQDAIKILSQPNSPSQQSTVIGDDATQGDLSSTTVAHLPFLIMSANAKVEATEPTVRRTRPIAPPQRPPRLAQLTASTPLLQRSSSLSAMSCAIPTTLNQAVRSEGDLSDNRSTKTSRSVLSPSKSWVALRQAGQRTRSRSITSLRGMVMSIIPSGKNEPEVPTGPSPAAMALSNTDVARLSKGGHGFKTVNVYANSPMTHSVFPKANKKGLPGGVASKHLPSSQSLQLPPLPPPPPVPRRSPNRARATTLSSLPPRRPPPRLRCTDPLGQTT